MKVITHIVHHGLQKCAQATKSAKGNLGMHWYKTIKPKHHQNDSSPCILQTSSGKRKSMSNFCSLLWSLTTTDIDFHQSHFLSSIRTIRDESSGGCWIRNPAIWLFFYSTLQKENSTTRTKALNLNESLCFTITKPNLTFSRNIPHPS